MPEAIPATDYANVFAGLAARATATAELEDRLRVLVLRNITVEGLDALLLHHLQSMGVDGEVVFGGYGSMVQDLLASDGPAARLRPTLIVLALSLDELDPGYGQAGWSSGAAREQLASLLALLAAQSSATVVVHTFLPPLWPAQGLLIDAKGLDLPSQVEAVNRGLVQAVQEFSPRLVLIDHDRILRRLGAAAALDPRGRYLWRAPFKRAFLDDWARQLARVGAALLGRAKKVLVLDCDDTLWGGVVGEDGIDGIALQPGEYPGRAYFEFQANVLQLAQRGVLLVLCSKNNEADVLQVLDQHPHCLIQRQHLAGYRVNWQDKASNIASLAKELNLGLDSFVFVDDNPVECQLVAGLLPAVTVLQVPGKLYELPPMLFASGLFDTLQVTQEDRDRAQMLQVEAHRKADQGAFETLGDYLASLQIEAEIHRAGPAELARVAQLTQRTNQFNLTTRRYSEPEIAALMHSADAAVYTLTVRDRFGSLGLVGVLIARLRGEEAVIDTFLMSCRALGRQLEDALLEVCLAELAGGRGAVVCRAEYLPTLKNTQVADYWPRRGFIEVDEGLTGQRYRRDIAASSGALPAHVKILRG